MLGKRGRDPGWMRRETLSLPFASRTLRIMRRKLSGTLPHDSCLRGEKQDSGTGRSPKGTIFFRDIRGLSALLEARR